MPGLHNNEIHDTDLHVHVEYHFYFLQFAGERHNQEEIPQSSSTTEPLKHSQSLGSE